MHTPPAPSTPATAQPTPEPTPNPNPTPAPGPQARLEASLVLRGISSMATRALLTELAQAYRAATAVALVLESVGGVDAARRVRAGEALDVVLLASDAIDALLQEGHLLPGSRVDWVRSGVAVAVPAGAALPDVSTPEALRAAVLAAPSVGYSTGPSGVALASLFDQWGITQAIAGRSVQAPPGVPVGSLVARGEVGLGFQQLSELIAQPGIQIVGPLPAQVQITTTFAAAIGRHSTQAEAVRALLRYLAAPEATAAKLRQGMQPL